ncbi:uncharacterized protein TNCT_99641 [Trichonephila clavata]|uniref:Uncharacterized protein n=1 Tax=Trichonephila clavata TaxID=2740835 RepID=A0A8X6LES6_TRICU|nr:uncharacterized protein TNCT_99641 [Trichonephila clavata]
MEDVETDDDVEEKLFDLQNNIQHIERKMRITESEKKADTEESNSKIKKNELEIKRLRMEIKELQVRIERYQKTDENIVTKEFQKHCRELGNFKGKSAKEAVQMLEAEALDLQRKSKSLNHEMDLKNRALQYNEEQYKDMISNCEADFENEPTEYHSIQYTRELENECQKINKYITECEIAGTVFKQMKEQLEENRLSYVNLLLSAQKEYERQEENKEKEISDEKRDIGALEENGLNESKKLVRFSEKTDENHENRPSEQETELVKMKEILERIKDTVEVSDIQDIENNFLAQKATEEKLVELKKMFSKTLYDLKTEKKQLDSRMELLRGANAGCPKRELEDELRLAKSRLEEQEKRITNAKMELDKIVKLLSNTDELTQKLGQAIRKKLPDLKGDVSYNQAVMGVSASLEEILAKLENFACHEVPETRKK